MVHQLLRVHVVRGASGSDRAIGAHGFVVAAVHGYGCGQSVRVGQTVLVSFDQTQQTSMVRFDRIRFDQYRLQYRPVLAIHG